MIKIVKTEYAKMNALSSRYIPEIQFFKERDFEDDKPYT
ncbi:hypothetical protein AB434_2003 [Heyndrickxia coagulans]|jgi:hypothetical protein|uniref:Uncharacterized protein n=1 Tax=Heyndrickxia coagulans TaxID=1398 RepID=A0AAN0WD44_HEYCO|nr:hypothetical protein SB48_HM08orf05305 [Heyndrickxia coagulans]AKN54408.1 hypothetical protein AB434_2003 [Heyndrickxia coagulans]KYC60373.1 hypothetical protein B4100_0722 [Heyndrickxia coagulans]KYC79978.1 hypothetical protein B4096_0616 [Heyndrickxia coagulans]